jgi:hypothetical protein
MSEVCIHSAINKMFAFKSAQKLKNNFIIKKTWGNFFVAIIALNFLTNQIFFPFILFKE